MSWLSRLLGADESPGAPVAPTTTARAQIITLRGDGEFGFDIVGESHYQDALSGICGGPCEAGHEHACVAALIPEPNNPYDANAVAVAIGGKVVGYLATYNAIRYQKDMTAAGYHGVAVACKALIVGGWDRGGGDVGSFGVKLDLAFPIRAQDRKEGHQ